MIRFLDLQNQICEGQKNFAFYDTISDTILTFQEQQVFDSLEEFTDAYENSYMNEKNGTRPLDRFTDLIPKNYFLIN